MLSYRQGTVKKITKQYPGYTEVIVKNVDDKVSCAINYDNLTGPISVGDTVIINTTATELGLGTGGYDFVISNLNRQKKELTGLGHIMKLRYTPFQFKTLSVEEEESPYHKIIREKDSLDGAVVIIGTLHSMLSPIAFAINGISRKKSRVIYVMTDGASLPLMFSNSVRQLTNNNYIQGSITAGHAFGGDLEAINIYSALLAAKWVLKADCIIVCMGPGIVGTGTKWGFTGIEQGQIINAVASLKGIPIAVPRVSFADPRTRHRGLSHHTITVLKHVALAPAIVPFGLSDKAKMEVIIRKWTENKLNKHKLIIKDTSKEIKKLANSDLNLKTMGRGLEREIDYFSCCLAAGVQARELINEEQVLNNPLL
jgi:hypothetical protein